MKFFCSWWLSLILVFKKKRFSQNLTAKRTLSWNKILHSALKYPAKSSVSESVFLFRTSGQKGKQFLMSSIDLSFGAQFLPPLCGHPARRGSGSRVPQHILCPGHQLKALTPALLSTPLTTCCLHHSPDKLLVSLLGQMMSYADLDAGQDSGQDTGARMQMRVGDPQKWIGSSSTHVMMWWWQWLLMPGHSSAAASAGGSY